MKDLFSRVGTALTDAEADARGLEVLADYEAHWRAFPDVPPCLEAVSHLSLGIVSNGLVSQQTDKLKRLGILDRFRAVVVSEEVGVSKPRPEIFAEAARRAGVPSSDCVYVGDKLEVDALGARAAGWRGIWLNRAGEDRPCEGVAVIRSLAELPDILRRTP